MADVIIVTDAGAQGLEKRMLKWLCELFILHTEALYSCSISLNPSLLHSGLDKTRASVRKVLLIRFIDYMINLATVE